MKYLCGKMYNNITLCERCCQSDVKAAVTQKQCNESSESPQFHTEQLNSW